MNFFASPDTADWLEQTMRKWLERSSRLAKRARVERIRQLNRGAAVVTSSCLSFVEKTKKAGKSLNLQSLCIVAENCGYAADGTHFGKGKKSAAHKLQKLILWCLATLQPAPEQVTA